MPYHRHLLALGLLLVPLALLFWLGGSELRRLGERADEAVEAQSLHALRQAAQVLDGVVGQWRDAALSPTDLALATASPEESSWRLRHAQSAARHLLLLDEHGELLFPGGNPPGLGLALAPVPEHELLREGEQLLDQQRSAAALEKFEAYLELEEQPGELAEQARARFRRATILKETPARGGDARLAYEEFLSLFDPERVPVQLPAEVAGLNLFAAVALAQLLDDELAALSIMEDIALGKHDRLNDHTLDAVLRRLQLRIRDDPQRMRAAQSALERNLHRLQGRAFADEFGLIARETIGARIRASGTDQALYQVIVSQDGRPSLLMLRPATADEREAMSTRHALPSCSWVGVHANLDLLLYDRMGPFVTPSDSGIHLQITDNDGIPILPRELANNAAGEVLTRDTAYGLMLRAHPADPERLAADRAAAARIRFALLAALATTALAGALLLWRSVRRDAEVARMKIDFVSRVSHELKTPLALVRMYGETLARGRAKDPAQQQKFASIITRESERLTTLIDRILDFSRQGAGTLVYEPAEVDLTEVAAAVTEAYRPHVESRGLVVESMLVPPVRVAVDRNAFESALINLMENAVKYTQDPGPGTPLEVSVRAEGGRAVVEVADRGVGIPDSDRERIFDSFFRASNAGEVRGAGLGLHLVRHFVLAHQGSVRATPRRGGGTKIRLELPLA